MKYLDQRILFNIPVSINEDGIYKYEVYKDNVIIFVGNTFQQATSIVVLDITDIAKNYVSILKPPFNTTTIEKSDIVAQFKVILYNTDNSVLGTTTEEVFLTYRQPFYNSEVSTDLMDYTATTNKHQALLQGFNYASTSKNRTLLVPTYPAINTTNLTFDYIGLFSDATYRQEFVTIYNGFNFDINTVVRRKENTEAAGAYQFSIPLADFFMASSSLVTSSFNNLFTITGVPSYYEGEEDVVNSGDNVRVTKEYVNTRYEGGNVVLGLNLHYVTVYYTNGNSERVRYKDFILGSGNDASYVYQFKNILSINRIDLTVEWDDGGEEIITITPTKDWWQQLYDADNNVTGELTMILALKQGEADNGLDVLYGIGFTSIVPIVPVDICQAYGIEVKPRSGGALPSYLIAKFDNQSRYFLKWRDRYGMPQIQPFAGTETKVNDYSTVQMIDYKNNTRTIGINVDSKMTLNSKWLNDNVYPIYEGIFVSPYLYLYDAKEDKLYDVHLLSKDFTYKTFRNQGNKMFNIQLEVQLNPIQNIIY